MIIARNRFGRCSKSIRGSFNCNSNILHGSSSIMKLLDHKTMEAFSIFTLPYCANERNPSQLQRVEKRIIQRQVLYFIWKTVSTLQYFWSTRLRADMASRATEESTNIAKGKIQINRGMRGVQTYSLMLSND